MTTGSSEALEIRRSWPGSPSWPKDLDWMTRAYCDAVAEELTSLPYKDMLQRRIDSAKSGEVTAMLEGLLERTENACLFIAFLKDYRVGYFLGMVKPCLAEIPSQVGYVNGLYLLPSFRRQGIGKKLLEAGNQWFRNRGLHLVELYATYGNQAAKRFWEKHGYRLTEEVLTASLHTNS